MITHDDPLAGFDAHGERYEIVAVRHGRLVTERSRIYLNYDEYREADGPITLFYYFWVIRNATRTIVVDTGFSRQGAEARRREVLIPVPDALAELGITEDSAADVVLTHLHYDHAGNLALFPHQRIIMSRAEYEFWSSDESQRVQLRSVVDEDDVTELRRATDEARVYLVSGVTELAPGVRAIEIGGHTPGQLVVLVATAAGPVLLASDATHFTEELDRDMPFKHNTDLRATYRGLDLMRAWRERGEVAHIIPGHEPSTFELFPRLRGALSEHAVVIGYPGATEDSGPR
ncbi:MAG: N-acyl homoserine lactonase family protein [Pseudolysinimonas sp.]